MSACISVRLVSLDFFYWLLAGLRWWRPYTWRYQEEQVRIEKWLDAIARAASRDVALAGEIAACGQLIKGYGDTHVRAVRNYDLIAKTYFDNLSLEPAMVARANQSCAQRSDGRPRGPGVGERGQQIPVLNQATKPVCRCRGVQEQGKATKPPRRIKL